ISTKRSSALTASAVTLNDMDARTGLGIDFLITGHTHLERALRRKTGSGFYFNSGTWARLIQVDPAILDNPVEFKKFFDNLTTAKTLPELDKTGLVHHRLTQVVISATTTGTFGELRRVKDVVAPFQEEVVAGSRFPQ